MRSWVILALSVGAFVWIVVAPHRKADSIHENEEAALREVRRLGALKPMEETRELGAYRFSWARGGPLPAVLVARPIRPGTSGTRIFATGDGKKVYQLDPVLRALPAGRDSVGILRAFLALPEEDRRKQAVRLAWTPARSYTEEEWRRYRRGEG